MKEIRETSHCLRIIEKPKSYLFDLEVNQTKNESNQLISIVVVSIPTAKDNSEIKNC
ncbi:hypothetical protein Pf1_01239 [Flavobacterium columnare]|nr:hypothetical protein Pf1_01239 [Flavobacterium columnare]